MERRSFLKKVGAAALGATALSHSRKAYSAEKRFLWRMVTSWPPNFPILQTGAERLAKRVGELSGGRLMIQVYAGGELVPPLGVFDAVSQGTVECGHSASYYWAGKNPAFQWFTSIPFGLNAQGMNTWFYQGNGLKLWRELYSNFNIVPRPAGNTGVQMGGWFNKEINTIDDFKGLKMRIPGLGGKVIKKVGATVVLLPGGEIYTSLERGVIDATEWVGPAHDIRMGFHKVAKYYYGPGWHEPGSALEFIVNKKAHDALPEDLKQVLDVACAELNIQMLTEFEYENAKALKKLMNDHKVNLRHFPPQVLKKLRKVAKETIEQEAQKDKMAKKVHEDFKAFQALMAPWANISEQEYYTNII
ncbi:TRAP transporter solute receptor, unknown substrate 6 [Dissulfuribacter thermophilus]|uniref:ABC transporter substrate-binding protein n=1 Tax=Dissulfuribacter thermophilus TaxID=1156395 RepID=A0A1B9F5S9_9BACT|nr:TRAP transporter substrate-binding protein DctP [Dissulfuribacter thermophilus]OCC15276.1 TRAP transporter solute receptor, unknown substrate 6 [Dissulfuribacter thermophilus]